MKYKYLLIGCFASMLLWANSCSKKTYDNSPIPSEWLLPLIKGDISPLSITTINNKEFQFVVTGDDVGLSSTNPQSSAVPMTFYNLGPYELKTNDLIHSIDLDSCLVDLKVTNNFPVAIKAGTMVTVSSNGAPGAIVTLVFPVDVANGTSHTFELDLSNKTVGNKLYISLDEFTIDAYSNQTFQENVAFDLHFKTVTVHQVDIATNQSYDLRDTADFDGSNLEFDEMDQNITDSMVHATLNFVAKNELPINMNFQIHFLSATNTVIDSLFVPGANVTGAEYSGGVFTQASSSNYETHISKSRIERIKNATQVVYGLSLDSKDYPGATITVDRAQQLSVKIIGDIKLVLSSSIF